MRPQRRMNFILDRYAKKWLICRRGGPRHGPPHPPTLRAPRETRGAPQRPARGSSSSPPRVRRLTRRCPRGAGASGPGPGVTGPTGGTPARAHSRSGGELAGDDLVAERIGVEAVEPPLGRLGLWVHEEGDRVASRVRQLHVVRVVVAEVVHLPG